MVANFLMKDFPVELPEAPLASDNVANQEPGLGYVMSPRTSACARWKKPCSGPMSRCPTAPRLREQVDDGDRCRPTGELATVDLKAAYASTVALCVERVDITPWAARHGGAIVHFQGQCGRAGVART
jgi:hypothetical protein